MSLLSWDELLSDDRMYPEDNEGVIADPFERDYNAIIFSAYTRRLKDKTQVFPLEENDSVRNRLTHSLEVSAIAKDIAEKIADRIAEEHPDDILVFSSTDVFKYDLKKVSACAGLLHDIGNPPFGHTGETYIREWINEKAYVHVRAADGKITTLKEYLTDGGMWDDLTHFEGNAQDLRIVTRLARRTIFSLKDELDVKKQYLGLNLTYAVLGSIIKYPCAAWQLGDSCPYKKNGYYTSEDWVFEDIADHLGTRNDEEIVVRDPVMLIMEAADDIAYTFSDIDDFVKKEHITQEEVYDILRDSELLKKNVNQVWKNDYDNRTIFASSLLRIAQLDERELFKNRVKAINDACDCFMANYDDIMDGTFDGSLVQVDSYVDEETYKNKKNEVYRTRDYEAETIDSAKQKMFQALDIVSAVALTANVTFVNMDEWISHLNHDGSLMKKLSNDQVGMILDEAGQSFVVGQNVLEENIRVKSISDTGEQYREKFYCYLLAAIDYVAGMTDAYVSKFIEIIFSREEHDKYNEDVKVHINELIGKLYTVEDYNAFDTIREIMNRLGKYASKIYASNVYRSELIYALYNSCDHTSMKYDNANDGQIFRFLHQENDSTGRYNQRYIDWLNKYVVEPSISSGNVPEDVLKCVESKLK